MKIVDIETKTPYKWQRFCFNHLSRYNVIVAPRQHGKTEFVCEVINSVAHAPLIKNPLINLCSDKASRLYPIYSQRLTDLFGSHDGFSWPHADTPSTRIYREDRQYALLNFIGSIVKPTGCTGTPSHLNVIDEASLVSSEFIFKSAMPATDKTGGITIITGTVSNNQYRDTFKHGVKKMLEGDPYWFVFYMYLDDDWSKDVLTKSQIQAIKARYNLDIPEQKLFFDTEYMCNWDVGVKEKEPYLEGVINAVSENRVIEWPLDLNVPVGLSWDDGRGTTGIWAYQLVGSYVYILDYLEWHSGDLVSICKNRLKWYDKNGFIVGPQVLPHTMEERSYTLESKISRSNQLISIFREHFRVINKPVPVIRNKKVKSIETKLLAGKSLLPRCYFHPRCFSGDSGLDHLKRYSRVESRDGVGKVHYKEAIKSDEHSHAGDSFGELAMAFSKGELSDSYHNLIMPNHQLKRRPVSVLHPYITYYSRGFSD